MTIMEPIPNDSEDNDEDNFLQQRYRKEVGMDKPGQTVYQKDQ